MTEVCGEACSWSAEQLAAYNAAVAQSSERVAVVLAVSPELQNVPFEALAMFSEDRFVVTRQLCLQSLRDMNYPNGSVGGYYCVNISCLLC